MIHIVMIHILVICPVSRLSKTLLKSGRCDELLSNPFRQLFNQCCSIV